MYIFTMVTILLGGLCLPCLCAAIALQKNRSPNLWFGLGCTGFVSGIGGLIAMIVILCLPSSAAAEGEPARKLLGMQLSAKQLYIGAALSVVSLVVGLASLIPSIMTILGALK